MSDMYPNEGPLWPCGCLMGDPACHCELPPLDIDECVKCDAETLTEATRAVAAPVVAAELRRQADEIDCGSDAYIKDGACESKRATARERKRIADRLRARADELAGPQS